MATRSKKLTISLTEMNFNKLKMLSEYHDIPTSTLTYLVIRDWLTQWEVDTNVTTIPIYKISSTKDTSSAVGR